MTAFGQSYEQYFHAVYNTDNVSKPSPDGFYARFAGFSYVDYCDIMKRCDEYADELVVYETAQLYNLSF